MWQSASRIVVVSNVMKAYLVARGILADLITVAPNGVDPDLFSPSVEGLGTRAGLGLADRRVLAFSGTRFPWNDVEILVRVLLRLPADVSLLVVGSSPLVPEPTRVARTTCSSDRVVFVPRVPHDQVPSYLAAADVLVAPYKHMNVFYFSPLKVIEYMAMGRPVVATRLGQVEELLVGGCGVLVAPGDEGELAAAVTSRLADPEGSRRMGELARARVLGGHTWKHNVDRVMTACRQALASS
jgi:glycosyltransferase involved in cell wall biosynthesis